MTMLRLAVFASVLVGCSGSGNDRAATTSPRQACTLFEGVSKTVPPGGVPITIDVPGWQRTDDADGSCRFASPEGARVTVSLEFCGIDPCPLKLEGGRVRATTNRKLGGQTMRTNTLRLQDPTTHYIVSCRANVQGTEITPALEAQLQRGAAVCDTLAFAPRS